MDNESFENTAAMAPVRVEEKETPRMLYSMDEFVISPSGKAAMYCALIGGGLGLVLMGAGYGLIWFVPGFIFVAGGAGGLAMLNGQLRKFAPSPRYERITTMPEQQPRPQETGVAPVVFDLGNGLPVQQIRQPRPAAFSSWLRAVVDDDSRITFSKNQATGRGWDDEGYAVLLAQLRECGLLHATQRENGAPALTDNGRTLAKQWLSR